MTARALAPLMEALDAKTARGERVAVWWRDDDAVAATPALERLLGLAGRHGVPVAVAAIPAVLDRSLPARLAREPEVRVLVHGWRHANHAGPGVKPAEFGPHRPLATMLVEARDGLAILADAFGEKALPIFVPPWNRIDPRLAGGLAEAGYRGLSTFAGGEERPGLDTHLDPVDWRGGRGLADPDTLVRRLASRIARGTGPFALLTHHLVMEAEVWAFVDATVGLLAAHPAVSWPPLDSLRPLSTNATGSDTVEATPGARRGLM